MPRRKTIITHIVLLVLAFLTVVGIAHQTMIEVESKEELRTMSCGWPLAFIINDQSWRDPPYPWTLSCLSGEWGDVPTIQWRPLLIDGAIFYFAFAIIWEGVRLFRRRYGRSEDTV